MVTLSFLIKKKKIPSFVLVRRPPDRERLLTLVRQAVHPGRKERQHLGAVFPVSELAHLAFTFYDVPCLCSTAGSLRPALHNSRL